MLPIKIKWLKRAESKSEHCFFGGVCCRSINTLMCESAKSVPKMPVEKKFRGDDDTRLDVSVLGDTATGPVQMLFASTDKSDRSSFSVPDLEVSE